MDMKTNQLITKLAMLFILAFVISSCAYTTAVSSGASAVYDRHSIQKSINDQLASMHTYGAIYVDHKDDYKNTHVSVATFNNVVLLIGQVYNSDQKTQITQLAKTKNRIRQYL